MPYGALKFLGAVVGVQGDIDCIEAVAPADRFFQMVGLGGEGDVETGQHVFKVVQAVSGLDIGRIVFILGGLRSSDVAQLRVGSAAGNIGVVQTGAVVGQGADLVVASPSMSRSISMPPLCKRPIWSQKPSSSRRLCEAMTMLAFVSFRVPARMIIARY